MIDREKEVRRFRLVAGQRLETALFLLRASTHFRDSIYLAGYSVECALKAMILRRTPRRMLNEIYKKITEGSKAHDYEFLKAILKRAPINDSIPARMAEFLLRVNSWGTEYRYEVGVVPYDDARDFVEATQQIYEWSERILS